MLNVHIWTPERPTIALLIKLVIMSSISIPTPHKFLHIEAMQSAPPGKMTEPGRSRPIFVASPIRHEALQSRLRVILYYNKVSDDGSAVTVGGWIKESLTMALAEHPVLAGRLRRDHESDDGFWEIKFNDAGVRLVHAAAEITMSEFLALDDREVREELLASWVDVDGDNPEFSALFYVQVTEFEGDGYSVGISCSLLLADPLLLSNFLKEWALSHSLMLTQANLQNTPLFHLNYFINPHTHLKSIPLIISNSTQPNKMITSKTILFNVPCDPNQLKPSRCLAEATKRLDGLAVSEFTLITVNKSGESKVEFRSGSESESETGGFGGALNVVGWDELGLDELAFSDGNKPVNVSCRVVSGGREGVVVAVERSDDENAESGLMVFATVPKEI